MIINTTYTIMRGISLVDLRKDPRPDAAPVIINKNPPNNALALPVVFGNSVIALVKLSGKIVPPAKSNIKIGITII